MKLGAEPTKVAIVGVLLPAATYLMWTNLLSAPSQTQAPPPAKPALTQAPASATAPPTAGGPRTPPPQRMRRSGAPSQEWVPKIGVKRPEDRPDLSTINPSLRVDLLARLQTIEYKGSGERSLFEFGAAPPKIPDVTIDPKAKKDAKGGATSASSKPGDPPKTSATKPADTKPQAPPIPLKFYGFVNGSGGKRAFFLGGDDIFMAGEGQMVQSRYKIVRIGLNSAEVEDTQYNQKQTLPLEEPKDS